MSMLVALLLLALARPASAGRNTIPGYPLAVKTPYLHTWLLYNESTDVPSAEPQFWQGQTLTWQVMARVDNDATYCLFGCGNDDSVQSAQQSDISYTSTHTFIDLKAGSACFTLDFFSPVSLWDYTRQSMPYSYLRVKAEQTEKVDIMMAIDDTWTSLQPATQSKAIYTDIGSRGFMLSGTNQIKWGENDEMAEWGDVVIAATCKDGQDVTMQIGSPEDIKSQFISHGRLSENTDGYQSGNLAAVAYSLKDRDTKSVTFAIGVEQEDAFNYLGESQTGYYAAEVGYGPDAVDYFFNDEEAALTESHGLDHNVTNIGNEISSNYSDILESAVRQVMGGSQILIPLDSKDTDEAGAWAKEISTDGNIQTLADLLPKIFPMFHVLAPDYLRLHLKPVMEYTLQWPADFTFHDMGKHYPNATGETPEEQEALIVDQTSVILWMAYQYQKVSGDTEFAKPYYAPLQRYADYLVENGLYPAKQQSSVDSIGPTANQTVLAMYAAIGLTSFGALTGQQNYTDIGKSFAPVILNLGTDPEKTHITAHYNDNASSWITTYPLAFDKLMDLNTFDQSVYDMQSKWYESKLDSFGMPFFSGVDYAVGSFLAWGAASSSDYVRDALINGIHHFQTEGTNSAPGPTRWKVTGNMTGKEEAPKAKGTVGSFFMPAAVKMAKDNARKAEENRRFVVNNAGASVVIN